MWFQVWEKVASPHLFLEIDITPFQTKPVISTKTAPLKTTRERDNDLLRHRPSGYLVPTSQPWAIMQYIKYCHTYMQDLFSHLFRFTELSFAKQQIPQVISPLCILGYLMCAFYSRPNVKTWSRGSLSACRGIMIRPSPSSICPSNTSWMKSQGTHRKIRHTDVLISL